MPPELSYMGRSTGAQVPRGEGASNAARGAALPPPRPAFQPLPSVDPASDLAVLLDPSLASVLPALDSAAFDGFADLPELPDLPVVRAISGLASARLLGELLEHFTGVCLD